MLSLGYFIFIYLGKPEILIWKFNCSGNSVWGRGSGAGKALGIYRKYGFPREAMAVFLLLLDSPADFDILCCGSFSRKLKFNR